MSVIDTYYGVVRNPGEPALTTWLESWLDERASMNRALLAEQLRAQAPGDDAKLEEIAATLRERQGKIAKAMADYKMGNMNALNDLVGTAAKVEIARTNAAASTSIATGREVGAGRRKQAEIAADTAARINYDRGIQRRVEGQAEDMSGRDSDPQTLEEIDTLLGGAIKDAGGDEAGKELLDAKIRRDYIKALRDAGNDDLADAYAAHTFNTTRVAGGDDPEDVFFANATGLMSDEQRLDYERAVSAGIPGMSKTMTELFGAASDQINDGTAGGRSSGSSTGTRTSSAPAESESDTTPGLDVSSIRFRGSPDAVRAGVRAAQEGRPDEAMAALTRASQGIEDQLAAIEARREQKRKPMQVASNYLIDNPFTYVAPPEKVKPFTAAPRGEMQIGQMSPDDEDLALVGFGGPAHGADPAQMRAYVKGADQDAPLTPEEQKRREDVVRQRRREALYRTFPEQRKRFEEKSDEDIDLILEDPMVKQKMGVTDGG